MKAAIRIVKAAAPPGAAAPPPPRAEPPALARRIAARLRDEWLPRAAWTVGRTGRPGLAGLALLLAAALFLLSTHLQVAAEVEALRAEVAAARGRPRATPARDAADPAAALRALPGRGEMPAILRQLFNKATQAQLALESGKYEISSTRSGGVVRYHVVFPVAGPYPQIRAFVDSTLAAMPAVALEELALARKSIADASVEAQIRLTVFTAATPARAPEQARAEPREAETGAAPDRVVAPRHAAALFAQHTWHVMAPPPPPPPPAPPPEPTAPPLPYAFLGSFAPAGEKPVFFLAHGDRVIDARVGDRLDGVYQLESARDGQLVFVYLPLDIRQTLAAGAPK